MFALLTAEIENEEEDEIIDQFHGAYYMTREEKQNKDI